MRLPLYRFWGSGLTSQLLRANVWSMLVRVAALGSSLTVSIVLARMLGVQNFGTYTFVLSLTAMIALPVQIGLPTLVLRETARAEAEEDWSHMRGIWSWAARIVTVASIMIAFLGFLIVSIADYPMTDIMRYSLILSFVLVLPVSLSSSVAAALRGLRRVILGQFPFDVLRPMLLLFLVLSVVYLGSGTIDATTALASYLVAAIATLALSVFFLAKVTPSVARKTRERRYRHREWFRALIPLALMSGIHIVIQNTDLLMLGFFLSSTDVGIYKIAVSAAGLVLFGLSAIQTVCMPYISKFKAQGDWRRLQALSSAASLGALAMAIPIFGAFLVWGEPLIVFTFGQEYAAAYRPLLILCAAQLVNAFFGIVWPILIMTGHEAVSMRGLLLAAIVNVCLNALFIPHFGVEGAAMATGASIVFWNVYFWIAARRLLRIDCSPVAAIQSGKLQGDCRNANGSRVKGSSVEDSER